MPIWDDRSFYDFVATSRAFAARSFRHREVFGQVGFGTGGWDTDFPNSMLEILRVVVTNCDEDQRLVVGGVEQLPRRLWRTAPERHGPLARRHHARALHGGAPEPGVVRIEPAGRRPHPRHRPLGRPARVPGRARDLPVLAAHHPHRLCRGAVLAPLVDGARPHPLHAVGQDLRHGRPAVLEGARPGHRPLPDEHDALRPPDPRHLPVRRRPGQAGGDLPVLLLDGRRPEAPAAADRPARRPDAGCLAARSTRTSTSSGTSSAIRSPSPGRATPTSSAPSRARCPATTATTAACTATSCRTACRRRSAACSSPATTSPGRRAGSRVPSPPASTPSGASSTTSAAAATRITRARATGSRSWRRGPAGLSCAGATACTVVMKARPRPVPHAEGLAPVLPGHAGLYGLPLAGAGHRPA